MEARSEDTMFETSHVLGAELASSPLLALAWRQCGLAAAAAATASFAAEEVDDVLYVAFSGAGSIQSMIDSDCFFSTMPLASACGRELFSPLVSEDGDVETVLVQACALQLFFSIFDTPQFWKLMETMKTGNKKVIFTGHSVGGSLASLVSLYFLCSLLSSSSSQPFLLCITFGSPLLGNEALSQIIIRERWTGKFCHVVSQHDIVPRLLFCPQNSISIQLIICLLQSCQFYMACPLLAKPSSQSSSAHKAELHQFISNQITPLCGEQKLTSHQQNSKFMPFGCYALCSNEGMVCIDNPIAVIRMLCLTFMTGSAKLSIEEEHLCYGGLVKKASHLLMQKNKIDLVGDVPRSNCAAGISLALKASGIGVEDKRVMDARQCLEMSMKTGRSPSLNCANLSIRLAKITPCRAQIEWYKACCDSDMGYYDSFKQRKASKRDSKVNMNRIKLACFWDDLVDMVHSNQLPHDVHKRAKWVNAAHFYQLLVEPLDIAEYYRVQMHKTKGHYLAHGRERRYEVFDKWWRERHKGLFEKDDRRRSKFAGLTQDPCFWARVEEAREWLEEATSNCHGNLFKLKLICEKLNAFDFYASTLVEKKEVSVDVLAPNSSYNVWLEEWKVLKVRLGLQFRF
ncbi:hypothetical protein IEQ34_011226 [Dendrobium chrysotoxum]|uniref:Lipase-like PAD4 n=1 Tax=Dendrobium chrysotoxum TaxID=161865 RepID=A0AAV7GY28_DENCH|nr:hypothetical protein IEQ34_011226 [Dendrobium chrysotoxum]